MTRKLHGAAVPLIAVDRTSDEPLHRQIYTAFRAMVLDRRLHPGQQIPSTRALADELGISRIPVLGAYGQLLAEGYIESRSGAGTFVTNTLPEQLLNARPAAACVADDAPPAVVSHVSKLLPVEKTPWFPSSVHSAWVRLLSIPFRFAFCPTWSPIMPEEFEPAQ